MRIFVKDNNVDQALRFLKKKMQREGLLFLVHGEVTDADIDVFDREAVFVDRVMTPLRAAMPELKDPKSERRQVFDQILKKKLDLRSEQTEPWPLISPGGKDFVQKLLERDPRRRLTAAQALAQIGRAHV